MFEIKIYHYKEEYPPYEKGLYYKMVLNHHMMLDFHLENKLLCQVQDFKEFDKRIHKDKHLTKWLSKFKET